MVNHKLKTFDWETQDNDYFQINLDTNLLSWNLKYILFGAPKMSNLGMRVEDVHHSKVH